AVPFRCDFLGGSVIRVLFADDQALVRAGFRALLDSAPDISVVAEAATGAEAVRLAVAERPDIALLDIRMPELDGLAAAERILADPGCRRPGWSSSPRSTSTSTSLRRSAWGRADSLSKTP